MVQGKNIYRLKQVDIDGKFDYSVVRTVWFDRTHKVINIHPNPARESVTISGLDGDETIQVYDVLGKRVSETKADQASVAIPMGNMIEGIYYIRITSVNGAVSSHKIVKSN